MKRKYSFSVPYKGNEEFLRILDYNDIKGVDIMGNYYACSFLSDHPYAEEILNLISKKDLKVSIDVVFSKEDLENANWYLFEVIRLDIQSSDSDYTYEYSCPYDTVTGIRYRHVKQVNYCVSKRTPKWKNNYNFCADNYGDYYEIYCSDIAKKMIKNRDIVGIDFWPVVNKKGEPTENVSQLVYKHTLSVNSFKFIGKYREFVCPTCGYVQYPFDIPGEDNVRLLTETIPRGIDAFVADFQMCAGQGRYPVIVSKKVYNLIAKEMKEKHVRFTPIG